MLNDTASGFIAGHRVIRRLHECPRCSVLLARDDGAGTLVVVKAFSDLVTDEAFAREVRALETAESEHIVRLLDISVLHGSPRCLILQRLGSESLADLISHSGLTDGQVATVACAALTAIADLRQRGVARSPTVAADFLIDATGRPVIVGWSEVVFAGEDSWDTATLREQQALGRLMGSFGSLTDDRPLGDAVNQAAERLGRPEGASSRELRAMSDAVLDARAPEPLVASPARAMVTPLGRIIPLAPVEPATEQPSVPVPRSSIRSAIRRGATRLVSWRPPAISRRRLILGAGAAAVVAVVVGLLVIPTPTSVHPADNHAESSATSSSESALGLPADPAAAAAVLVGRRHGCIVEGSSICLDSVDQDGSALLTEDRALLDAGHVDAPDAGPDQVTATVTERDGDVAIVALADAQGQMVGTALVIETENGWRLRSIALAPPAS